MSDFYTLTEDQKVSLFKLIFHVGHWISSVDETGGEHSKEQEQKALKKTLIRCTHRYKKSTFVSQLLKETLEREMHWERWSAEEANITDDAKQALEITEQNVGITEAATLKILIMEIAVYVARAYREFNDRASVLQKFFVKIKLKLLDLIRPITKRSAQTSIDLLDISEKEEMALNELAKTLGFRTFENYRIQYEKA